ncbi:MAG: hypothetical protein OXU51_01915 [Candidatus Poribacteria bacterium]|nr:hypothetical protein [Candidatus Poribacteria bacterium]
MNLNKSLTHIQKQVSPDSLTKSCSGERCTVHLDDIPPEQVIINVEKEFDSLGESRKRCDRLLFYGSENTFFAVPIELKGRGKGDESDVLEQLKSGLEFAATLVSDLKEPIYVPIAFTKNGIKSRSPKRQNRELKVKFQGKTLTVLTGRCGREKNLANLLSKAGYL